MTAHELVLIICGISIGWGLAWLTQSVLVERDRRKRAKAAAARASKSAA